MGSPSAKITVCDDHAHQDFMLTALVQPRTLSRSVKGNDLMRKRHHRAVKGSGRSILFVLICIFGGAPTEMAAQESLPVEPGVRVRVTAPECELRGQAATFRALRADTLVLGTTECPLASVTRLEVSRQKSMAVLGVLVGAGAGALGALALCLAKDCVYEHFNGGRNDFSNELPLILGVVGGVAGFFVGRNIKTDRWEEVSLEQLRVSPQPDGGFALGFSVRF